MDSRPSVPAKGPESRVASDRLESWKEIASYLKRDVRTAQRWEATEEMPVYRHQHHRGGSIYAFKSEIDAWWTNRTRKKEEKRLGIISRQEKIEKGFLRRFFSKLLD